jgi:hypothetical protein
MRSIIVLQSSSTLTILKEVKIIKANEEQPLSLTVTSANETIKDLYHDIFCREINKCSLIHIEDYNNHLEISLLTNRLFLCLIGLIIPRKWLTKMLNLTVLSLPISVTTIPYGCFNHCIKLRKEYYSSSLIFIGKKAFNGCTSLRYLLTVLEIKTFDIHHIEEMSFMVADTIGLYILKFFLGNVQIFESFQREILKYTIQIGPLEIRIMF